MKIQSVSSYYNIGKYNNDIRKNDKIQSFSAYKIPVSTKGMDGDRFVMKGKASEYFELYKNLSNPKVGSKFLIKSNLPEYKDLTLLITPDTVIKSDDLYIAIAKKGERTPSFKGRLYGSIREENGQRDYKMEDQYIRFWQEGMHDEVSQKYLDKTYAPQLKDDYNFFIPSDGDGTRYKDITTLQGGITKPASYIPATLNGKNMSLVQTVITNYTKTGKLDKWFDFVRVKPAQGSAYAFLEGLADGKISTKKPLVFGWGDNFSDVNVSKIMQEHEKSGAAFTITTIPVDKQKTKSLSIVKLDSLDSKTINQFVEKPQDEAFIDSCVIPELGDNTCLAAVGPYIISPQALEWIKSRYIQNPENFKNPDKGYDFSSMIIAPILEAIKSGEIVDSYYQPMEMKLAIIPEDNTWSDLGSQKDFSSAMKSIKNGKYIGMPLEVLNSIKKNVDQQGNITFNSKSRTLFDSMLKQLNLEAKNVIAYCNE